MNILPKNWKITRFPSTISIENEYGEVMGECPVPYDPMSMQDLVNAAMEEINKKRVKNYMDRYFAEFRDDHTGDINLTLLAEGAAGQFDIEYTLDEENHWIWEMAAEYDRG